MSRDEPLFQCTAYKATRISEIVCKRTVTLFRDRVTTTHQDLSGEKCWYLDRSCRLEPDYVEEITVPEKRSVRPPGTWTVTAKLGTVTGSGQPVDLFCVTINWPTSWLATRGYTSFTLGFETAQEAAQWHSHVQRQVSFLRQRVSSTKGDVSTGHSSKPSYDGRSIACSGGGAIARKPSQDKGFIASALEHWLGSKEDKPAVIDEAGRPSQGMQCRTPTSPVQVPIPSRPSSTHNMGLAGEVQEDFGANGRNGLTSENSYSNSSADGYFAAGNSDEQRWVPYRHTNGVAIYHHKESKCTVVGGAGAGAAAEEPGSEYMASNIVRGSPDECLAVLMDMSSNTTILGPASKIELLEDGAERQVLRFTVEATGMARHLCAPREVIVERVFKREECGVDVILFSSCQPPPGSPGGRSQTKRTDSTSSSFSAALAAGSGWKHASSMPAVAAALAAAVAAGLWTTVAAGFLLVVLLLVVAGLCWVAAACSHHASSSGSSISRRSCSPSSSTSNTTRTWREWLDSVAAGGSLMLYRPVRASVQGGYTISPREDCSGINSPECLITCILKVDLGGCLCEHSWLRPFAAALGWVDAYVERMLMAVVLVKDEVEQRRFLVQPFSMLTNTAGRSAEPYEDEEAADRHAGTAAEQQASAAALNRRSSRWRNQQPSMPFGELSMRWLAAGGDDKQQDSLYPGPHGQTGLVRQQQQQQGSVGSSGAAELARQSSRKQAAAQQKQKGRLGRMASRIYALRPRMLRGGDRTEAAASGSQAEGTGAQQHRDSISFSYRSAAQSGHLPSSADAQHPSPFVGITDASGMAPAGLDLSDPKQLLASAGLPADTVVVEPSYYMGGPQGPAAKDSTLNTRFWSELHTPGTPAPFKLRGATYLDDRTKVDGGTPQFVLGSVDLVETPGPTQHISRYLPAVRGNQAAYSFVVNLIIPGTPVLSLVAVFINEHHPDILDAAQGSSSSSRRNSEQLDLSRNSGLSTSSSTVAGSQQAGADGSNSASAAAMDQSGEGYSRATSGVCAGVGGMEVDSSSGMATYGRPSDTGDWQPFDYVLHRFLHGADDTRTSMFKLIPHIAEGSWVIKQSVGAVPVILGNKLKTVYYQTDRYIEACVDVTSSSAAAYITGMVRGATKSLVIDLGFVLEGQQAEELPEALLGAFRLNYLDCTAAKKIDTNRELPLLPRPLQHHQLVALQQQAQQGLLAAAAGGAGTAAAAEGPIKSAEVAAASLWHSSELPSSNGAAQAVDAQQLTVDSTEQQVTAQQVQQLQQLQNLAHQLHHRCRNSLGVIETGRTMTGHARSRSAASVDELISTSNSPRAAPITSSKLQPKTSFSLGNDIASPSILSAARHQRQGSSGTASAAACGGATPRPGASSSAANDISWAEASTAVVSSSYSQPASARVNEAAAGAGFAVSRAHAEAEQGSSGSFLITATPAKQLLSFLNFTSDKGSGGKGQPAAGATGEQSGAADKGNSSQAAAAVPETCGAVSSLPTAASRLVAVTSEPNTTATLGAAGVTGGLLMSTMSVGSVDGHSNHGGVSTPTAAQQRPHHHRSNSNSEGRGAGGPGWPASPPSASVDWSSKMSAAAYISRAHAAALAASAERRTQPHQVAASPAAASSPVTSCHGGFAGDPGSVGSSAATAYLSVSPTTGGPREVSGDGSGSWLSKRPRNSSTGSGAILAGQDRDRDDLLQHQAAGLVGVDGRRVGEVAFIGGVSSATGAASGSSSAPGQKISATEQLRLTQSAFRASSASGGHASHHHSSSSSSSINMQAGGAGEVEYSSDTATDVVGPLHQPAQQQQAKHRTGHRRFASMGAVQ